MSPVASRPGRPLPGADPEIAAIRTVSVLTPEGVPLELRIARLGDRAAALLIDLLLLGVIVLAVYLLLGAAAVTGSGLGTALALVGAFLLRLLYFPWFEIRRNGVTPGKRLMGIRVVDHRGGALTSDAILARNLTRELEITLPLIALLAPGTFLPGAELTVQLSAAAWGLVFSILPFVDRRHRRAGDIIAGTMVIEMPKLRLLPELASRAAADADEDARGFRLARNDGSDHPDTRFRFSAPQLSHYGEYELEVLEDLIRANATDPSSSIQVAKTIARKIGWEEPLQKADVRDFLRAFYVAQRAHLEGRLLFGERKLDKRDTGGPDTVAKRGSGEGPSRKTARGRPPR